MLDAAYDRDSTTVDGNDFQGTEQEAQEDEGRSIVEALKRQGRRCPVLFGSQNGTAEAYPSRLSQYGRSTVSLTTMVVDAGVYDWTHLGQMGHDTILIFVLASFGEGEPTDNAANMYATLEDLADQAAGKDLCNLTYAAFGLGNKTYEQYNKLSMTLIRPCRS